jgi:2-hydroxy-3-keto-5-methylthiopentenyl-1-phosphate phosphatase
VLRIFVGFEGTIARDDVSAGFLDRFSGPLADTHDGSPALERLRRRVDAARPVSMEEARGFVRTQEIDETFAEFVERCRAWNAPVHIVSDGLDFCITEILAARNIAGVSTFANGLAFAGDRNDGTFRLAVRFPYTDAECRFCACCRRNIMLTHAGEGDIIVFAGAGGIDLCPARYADIVFAKRALQTVCLRENISYFPFNTFSDIVVRLGALQAAKSLHPRRRAEIRRRDVFLRE